jgi:hypothetical protein
MQILCTTQSGVCGTIIDVIEVNERQWKKQQAEKYQWFKETFGIKNPPKIKNKAPKQGRQGTKLEQAIEMYREFGGDRAQLIELFEKKLNMSKQGATTYYYLAKKGA